jgi:hypothetical protein
MQKISLIRTALTVAAIGTVGGWLWYPQLREDKLVGMSEIQEEALSALSFAKEYAIVLGVVISEVERDVEIYARIQPFIIFQGKKSPSRTDIITATGFASLTIGNVHAPVLADSVRMY